MCNITICKYAPVVTKDQLIGAIESDLSDPAVRAVLVSHADHDSFALEPVEYGDSVLNISRDLISHLNEYPHPDNWLLGIKQSIETRLISRENARISHGLSCPDPQTREWS